MGNRVSGQYPLPKINKYPKGHFRSGNSWSGKLPNCHSTIQGEIMLSPESKKEFQFIQFMHVYIYVHLYILIFLRPLRALPIATNIDFRKKYVCVYLVYPQHHIFLYNLGAKEMKTGRNSFTYA